MPETADTDVVIVGGGLSGLYLAYRLTQAGVNCRLLEARGRLGGRVQGAASPENAPGASYDLGPSWIWPDFQPHIAQLLRDLGLPIFEQYLVGDLVHEAAGAGGVARSSGPSAMRGSFRIAGGTGTLIDALAATIPADRIRLSGPVRRLCRRDTKVEVYIEGGDARRVIARQAVIALPPRLVVQALGFEPPLPPGLRSVFAATPTWMAGHAKVIALYERATWREQGLCGSGFSRRGPLTEIHDASPADGGPYALFGFVGYSPGARQRMGEAALLAAARAQLQRLYGSAAGSPMTMLIKDWAQDAYTATEDDRAPVSRHPDYRPPEQASDLWSDRLHFAGSEVATEHGGYLEGALVAARQVLTDLSIT